MFHHANHLGPNTFVTGDHHGHGDQWLSHFDRNERHHLVEEDHRVRNNVAKLLFSCMMFGLLITAGAVWWVAT
ncbi:MAG: hypothetical protein JSS27_05025 [Planctomycetes bacterium]|nr:hypothetical protein [Planctomycetota bacterium]